LRQRIAQIIDQRGDFERARIGNRCTLLAQPRVAKLQYFSDGHCL
jgi:hypothetical protein